MTAITLEGMIVPVVTPFDAQDRVDVQRLDDAIVHMREAGADYLMPTALTGEGLLLDEAETRTVWERAAMLAPQRFVPAILSYRTSQAVARARLAQSLGAVAIMVAPMVPELYAQRSHQEIRNFYANIAAAVPLPIIVFNYPSLTGVDYTPALLDELAVIDGVRFVKESTGDSRRVHGIRRACGERMTVICGNPTAAFESLALGCRSWITGIMNVAPVASKKLMRTVAAGELNTARQIYSDLLLPIVDLMHRSNNPTGTIKAGLSMRGVDVGYPRAPGAGLSQAQLAELKALMRRIITAEHHFLPHSTAPMLMPGMVGAAAGAL